MKLLHLALLGTLAVFQAGCRGPAEPRLRTALDCPERQGALTRTGMAADRRTCTYASAGGDLLSLRLLPAPSGPEAALRPIEAELQAEVALPAAATTAAA